jgi:hypothetical protein
MVLATIADPFMGRVVEGVEHVALEAGFNVLLSNALCHRCWCVINRRIGHWRQFIP